MDAQFGGEDQRKIFTFAEKVSSVVALFPYPPHDMSVSLLYISMLVPSQCDQAILSPML